MATHRFDPLAAVRTSDWPAIDLFVSGTVFLDIIFTGLERAPSPGTEEWAEGMASCPGGIANLAVAARRLGLQTALAAAFSDDDYGDFCWRTMEFGEDIDLGHSRRFADWHSPVTVSISVARDRMMVTHGHPSPVTTAQLIDDPPASSVVMIDLAESEAGQIPQWVLRARAGGSRIFADVGWDASERWDPEVLHRLEMAHAFIPNAAEAIAYTRTRTAQEAVYALADLVAMAVVTNGADGALGIDATTGEEASVPALRVTALDPTGAGDVFGAALTLGTLALWPLRDRLNFASLCSALAIQQFGGSLAAPGWGDIADWWRCARQRDGGTAYDASVVRRFGFLDDVIPSESESACRRATATIARRADVPGLT